MGKGRRNGAWGNTFWEGPLAPFGSEVLSHWALQIKDDKILKFFKLLLVHRLAKQRGV